MRSGLLLKELARIALGGVNRRWREYRNPMNSKFPRVQFEPGAGAYGTCHFEEGVKVGPRTILRDCSVGRFTYFAADSFIVNCRIGAFCSIGPEIRIGLGRHPTRDYVSTYPSFYSPRSSGRINFGVTTDFQEYLPMEIGNDVLLSSHCIVLDGVKIGDGAIVGAGAVVTRDVADYTVVAGSPARMVRQRFTDEEIAFLKELRWWERDAEWITKYAPLFRDIKLLMQTLSTQPTPPT